MTAGILITNYNTWTLTSESIQNCLKFADEKIDQFIVVDDCSTEPLVNTFSEIKLIRNIVNKGLVKSLNVGLQELDTDLIFIFDSDAWPLEEYIIKTKQYFLDNPSVGIAAFETENAQGEKIASAEPEPDAASLVLGQQLHTYYQKIFNKNPSVITVYTCAMVIRKEVLAQIGGFDENYDWLELDHDLCMSAIRKGWKIGVMPLRAFHKGSGTPQKVSHRVVRFYKNRLRLLKKFNKYPLGRLLDLLIVSRLSIEYALINTIGRIKYNSEKRQDKTASRSTLIKQFIKKEI
jgi:GT2 family glycosyltransferase